MSEKLCRGPAHAQPVWLPVNHFYVLKSGRNAGKLMTRCKDCTNWNKLVTKSGPHGYVPVPEFLVAATEELVQRCSGTYRVNHQHKVPESTIRAILNHDTPRVQRRTAQRILVALKEQRMADRRRGLASKRFRAARHRAAIIDGQMAERYGW